MYRLPAALKYVNPMIEINAKSATPTTRTPTLVRRLFSMLYEGLVMFGVLFAAIMVFMLFRDPAVPGAKPFFQAYLLLVLTGYFTWFWTHGGQTVAMRAWRFRLERRDGQPLRFPQACLRFALTWLSVLSILWAFVDRDKQFLHDRLAGTRLVMV